MNPRPSGLDACAVGAHYGLTECSGVRAGEVVRKLRRGDTPAYRFRRLIWETHFGVIGWRQRNHRHFHPREAGLRAQNAPVDLADIRPVRICRYAWIGNGCHIMKGVTIGEGAVIVANSVVISDIPPYSLAMGNPAEVYFRNYGRPSGTTADSSGSRP